MQTLAGDAVDASSPAWVQLSGEPSSSDVGDREPMKIALPSRAPPVLPMGDWTPGRILLTEASPSASPRKAPPTLPPSLALSLASALPPAPPPVAEAAFPPGLEGAMSPGSALHFGAAWAAMPMFPALAAKKLESQADMTRQGSDAETIARTSSEQSDEAELFGGSAASDGQREEVSVTANPGSVLHSVGRCSPCAWFWKPVGCRRGPACDHCHLCPEDERKNRKKKKASMLSHGSASPDCSPISFRSAGCSPKFSAGSATPGCSPTSGFQPAGFALNLSALL